MPHTKSLRPDWPKRVYRYHCLLDGPLPEAAWVRAHAMQELWNTLVALIIPLCPDVHEKPLPASKRRPVCQALLGRQGPVYCCARDQGATLGLSGDERWHIAFRFETALKAWRKGHAQAPKFHRRLERILFPYTPKQGGVDAAWLFQARPRQRVVLFPAESGHSHQRGMFTFLSGQSIPLRVLLHRPVPAGARLRQVALVGALERSLRREGDDGWQWSLQLTLELPPTAPPPRVGRAVGIDVGWHAWEYGLRIAVLHDGLQAWEVALPWDMGNRAMQRRQQHYRTQGATLDATGSWRELWDWQEAIDDALNACKTQLETIRTTGWPEAACALHAKLEKLHAGGLRALRRELWKAGLLLPVLENWQAKHTLQMRRFRGSQLHLHRARNERYRRIADWVAQHCDAVALEALDLRTLATKATQTRRARGKAGEHGPLSDAQQRERRAQKYRQMAGTSVLRRYIVEACLKRHRVVQEVPAAYSSRTCPDCHARLAKSAEVWQLCPQGHVYERDIGAASLHRQALGDEWAMAHAPLPVLLDNGHLLLRPLSAQRLAGAGVFEIPASMTSTPYGESEDDDIPEVVVPEEVLARLAVAD